MDYYLKLVAESPPNACEELHLPGALQEKNIYEDYSLDVQFYHDLTKPIRLELF